jgi:hypothetical protein
VRKLIVLFALAVLSLQAGVVYDNGGPNGTSGNEMTAWIQAEDFLLGAPTTLTDISFWSMEATDAYQGSIVWQIYSDTAGNPGTVLFSGTATPTRTDDLAAICCSFPIGKRNDFSVGSIALLGGTNYWLGLHNGPLTTTSRPNFFWATTAANTTATGHEDVSPFGDGGWYDNTQEHAFNLSGDGAAIPEPATCLLLGSALCGLALFRRRRA